MFQSFLIFYLSIFGISFAQNSPVLLWGEETPSKPALHTISKESFENLISPALKDSMILVFMENYLELIDLSMCKTESKETCFENLKNFKNRNYYADVKLPINTLKEITNDKQFVNLDNSGITDEPINFEIGKIVYVKFNDSLIDRSVALSEHDSLMAQVYNKLSKSGKILGIYTSDKKLLSRKVRQIPEITNKKLSVPGKFLLSYKKLTLKEGNHEPEDITLDGLVLVEETEAGATYELSGKHKIKFTVKRDGGYWSITQLLLGNEAMKASIVAGDLFSYYCGTNEFKTTTNKKLTWLGLQMEPNFDSKITGDFKFHDPWHCVGFTSPAIWMGIFVTFMFLFIISIGVTWLMDINTMDRFDDPKGKTITINTSE